MCCIEETGVHDVSDGSEFDLFVWVTCMRDKCAVGL